MTMKENPDVTFLTIRGDALLVLIRNLYERRKEEQAMLETILSMMDALDSSVQIAGEGATNANARLVSILKQLKPKETAGLSEEEIMKLVGGQWNETHS
ncbi:hypothetical protein [Xenorhabdus innexi]|uniref:Uncharacterized protein n=1 Tax=Xenorhabdus innexi TaxID=290109 RepID=A0A1N6MWJ8_9GAMM|nr:hypothetical protein [Xenorhabdus innexi]PHM35973.1 hypothetical protein Xinn_02043 [Xenorhabdus innexi]SIP73273.1 hypothetical protein XIS1_1790079 [Xenorhabdus innexi]